MNVGLGRIGPVASGDYRRGMPMSPYVKELRAKVGPGLVMFPSVSAVVLNDDGQVLLGQRSDNHRWSIIAGMMDPGEQPADSIVREIFEETGVRAEIDRLAGVAMHQVTYPNGDECQFVSTWFRCRVIGGEARVNDDESISVGWFGLDELPEMNPFALLRIRTAIPASAPAWFVPADEKCPDLDVDGW